MKARQFATVSFVVVVLATDLGLALAHPDMAGGRLLLEFWPWYLVSVVMLGGALWWGWA